jgi:hypothetical protein
MFQRLLGKQEYIKCGAKSMRPRPPGEPIQDCKMAGKKAVLFRVSRRRITSPMPVRTYALANSQAEPTELIAWLSI